MLYDEEIFLKVCREMNLKLDSNPDYDTAIERMKVFYPQNEKLMGEQDVES